MFKIYFTVDGFPRQADLKDFIFPGGEVQVVIDPAKAKKASHALIQAHLENSDDVMKLLLVTDAIRRLGINRVALHMPYVPYARQDRVANPGEAHALKVFANLINSQKYDVVHVFDPHSDVVEACFDNIKIKNNHEFVGNALTNVAELFSTDDFWLVSPDAGAAKKIGALASHLSNGHFKNLKVAQGGKTRDTVTGKLTGFTVDKEDFGGKPCVIVDDICDGGGTFLGLAKVLKAKNAGPLVLVVSHGIFSQGFADLNSKFDLIYCTDSFEKNLTEERMKPFPNLLLVNELVVTSEK